jgi:NADH-quinone oxidoreductase subunit N
MTGLAPIFRTTDLAYQAPLLVLIAGGLFLLLLDAFARATSRRWLMHLSVATVLVALVGIVLVWRQLGGESRELWSGMLVADRFGLLASAICLLGAGLALLLSSDYLREHHVEFGEYYPLVLLSTAGMVIVAMAADLVTVFLGIETMSLAVYVLCGSFRRSRRSAEAALKYYLMGAFATAFLVYGIALIYGAAGTTSLRGIVAVSDKVDTEPVFLIGELFVIVAFGFKLAAFPFHMWAPDAYEGAPTPVTAFMAAAVKATGFVGLWRVFMTAFGGDVLPFGYLGWANVLAVLAGLTMTVGNLAALRQENVKRMLAYSSISHAGYLLLGVVAAGLGEADVAGPALLYYLLAYTFTTVGAFGVVAWMGSRDDERLFVDDWAGLSSRHPAVALAMTVFLLSLAGMPPTAGFFGKFYVFRAAVDAWHGQLIPFVVIAVLNSVISAYYYLRVVLAMFLREPARPPRPLAGGAVTLALVLCTLFVLEMGLVPGTWLDLATAAFSRPGP